MSLVIKGVSNHAISRYCERAGTKDRERARLAILELAADGEPGKGISNRIESKGWTLIVNHHGWIETLFRNGVIANKSVLKKRRFDRIHHKHQ